MKLVQDIAPTTTCKQVPMQLWHCVVEPDGMNAVRITEPVCWDPWINASDQGILWSMYSLACANDCDWWNANVYRVHSEHETHICAAIHEPNAETGVFRWVVALEEPDMELLCAIDRTAAFNFGFERVIDVIGPCLGSGIKIIRWKKSDTERRPDILSPSGWATVIVDQVEETARPRGVVEYMSNKLYRRK